LLAPTFANLFWSDSIHSPDIRQPLSPASIHSPDIRQPLSPDSIHSPTFANHFPRTRYIRSRLTFATFDKNVTRLDTFARVICHFGEFGASGHCLKKRSYFFSLPTLNFNLNLFQSDIDRGFLTYAHDDSDTVEDHFDVSLFLEGDRSETFGDGRGRTGDLLLCKTTINITVLPKNDRPFR